MKANPQPLSATRSPVPIQAQLRFDPPEARSQIPEEKRAECLALLRTLIETVAGRPTREAGGADE